MDAPIAGQEPSLGELARDLIRESEVVLRKELALALAEMHGVEHRARKAAMLMLVAAAPLGAAIVLISIGLVDLAAVIGVARWVAGLVLGGAFAIVGAGLAWLGLREVAEAGIVPEKALDAAAGTAHAIEQGLEEGAT